jgi:MmyB-like transcription regulator ligand binding domain
VPGISAAVLDGLVAALQLSPQERAYVCQLIPVAGESRAAASEPAGDEVGVILQRVLDGLETFPVHVQNERCDIVASNALGRALYLHHFEEDCPNAVRFLFLDPRAHRFFIDWEMWADQGVYFLRSASARRPQDVQLKALIKDLHASNSNFRDAWDAHQVTYSPSGSRRLVHPEVGQLQLDFQNLEVAGQPRLRMTVYTAEPGSASSERLARLARPDHQVAATGSNGF